MNRPRLRAEDVKIFTDAALGFFAQTTGHRANVRTAYLLDPDAPAVWSDFHGRIDLGGRYRGNVTFAAPRALLTHVLLSIGESDYTDASHRDIVGEIANQMSGQARRHFGEAMDISPPRVITQAQASAGDTARTQPFVIPMLWDRYEAHLVVQMEQGQG
ncbi:MAG: chemotaxis protein CheX [Pseudomonadota bacterium]|nr:chemotaxis protein CheX [Pseudomonadota bacterium]